MAVERLALAVHAPEKREKLAANFSFAHMGETQLLLQGMRGLFAFKGQK
jgi:hypothetical protein